MRTSHLLILMALVFAIVAVLAYRRRGDRGLVVEFALLAVVLTACGSVPLP